jgi:catechol 2,3-dioxygenase-like lactoylglutathione lyase family enzyme
MKIEHAAYQVGDPVKVAAWYVEHLGLTLKRVQDAPPFGRFLADDGDHVMIELYFNTKAPLPDYFSVDPAVVHLAFYSEDVARDRERLLKAGATAVGDVAANSAGDQLAMLRDPWGFPVQLVRRAERMI